MKRLRVHIKGIVQGVGFRPFVYSLAKKYGLVGWVINDSRGVEIEVDGDESLQKFIEDLKTEAPPLSQIVDIASELVEISEGEKYRGFEIRESEDVEGERVLISPDVATCPDCLREMYTPGDPRYRYPFLNCTNCGPRFTIIEDLPYDRPSTTMREFPMCGDCRDEYETPSDRRFHAQPTCCPVCGPELKFLDHDGVEIDGDPIELATDFLKNGKIVAVKGLGGFHLACDTANQDAVRRLRERKHREAKPLAVMVGGISAARRLAEVNSDAESALLSPARPILILAQRPDTKIADDSVHGVTGGLKTIGIMLPYTPIHHLLFRPLPIDPSDNNEIALPEEIRGPGEGEFDNFTALVMTSGNISDEPIASENFEAVERLINIADGFLVHDRKIYRRADDSVATIRSGIATIWRWGRGHVPRPIFLPEPLPPALGVGGELKTTVCHIRNDKAFVSPHIGDLKTFETYGYFDETISHQEKILDVKPEIIACDMHPDYHSTRWAEERSEKSGLPLIKIQHHHAHAVALMVEHGLSADSEIICLAMDGTGYGTDGNIWGGEILKASMTNFERLGHITYAPLPGGDRAIKEVWRTAYGRLYKFLKSDNLSALFGEIPDEHLDVVGKMIHDNINSPKVCSLGRLFDAAAFLVGIRGSSFDADFDGQFPMLLEALVKSDSHGKTAIPDGIVSVDDSGAISIDGDKIILHISREKLKERPSDELALEFHEIIFDSLFRAATIACESTGISTVGMSGGCFMNRILHERLSYLLSESGLNVLTHRIMPPNDGCISLGQATSAAYISKK